MTKRICIAASLAALTIAPAAASANIVVNKSMAGIAIDDTEAEVRADRGAPSSTRYAAPEIGPKLKIVRYRQIEVTYARNGTAAENAVINLSTRGTFHRVKNVAGVGSTEANVKAFVTGVKCERVGTRPICSVGKFLPGRIVTTFFFNSSKRVSSVSLGRVID